MRLQLTTGFAAVALGTALACTAALAQQGPRGAPLSPGGISAAASAYGGPGPGFIGPDPQGRFAGFTPTDYSIAGLRGAPLSPGGISAAANSFGGPGPGYIGPDNLGRTFRASTLTYSNTGLHGAPLSPGGISAAANAFGGPGYMGP